LPGGQGKLTINFRRRFVDKSLPRSQRRQEFGSNPPLKNGC
jgi:hypothetical protein